MHTACLVKLRPNGIDGVTTPQAWLLLIWNLLYSLHRLPSITTSQTFAHSWLEKAHSAPLLSLCRGLTENPFPMSCIVVQSSYRTDNLEIGISNLHHASSLWVWCLATVVLKNRPIGTVVFHWHLPWGYLWRCEHLCISKQVHYVNLAQSHLKSILIFKRTTTA
jgi:hypothetical protein